MKKYACVNHDGMVVDLILASSQELAETVSTHHCILLPIGSQVTIGTKYINGEFEIPS